ncbi:hypothetical protein CAPTEDRAFT_190061 [Capitella teleta]|uniref:Major facilitator superfamily (MFS) profile domain-containing protein n=1 Tax=Capitella teleta TaxID=283909 RepID=R7TP00_CAPTE|nr:hypothetical protein CAPTEDRAFT_190061 [Capitella teleta]|eukprot:ELT95282.1 hypothetical protein CAPTEDRAFT_190061 [Capitella teleta]
MLAIGVRRLGFACGLVASFAYIGSSMVNDLRILYVTFGLIPGSVFCYYGLAGIVTLHKWFDKKISLAMAINFSGIAVGHFAWAPLTSWLVEVYSWRGAVLVLAAINLHCVAIFALLKTPEEHYGPSYANLTIAKESAGSTESSTAKQKKAAHRFIPDICRQPSYIAFHMLNILFNMSYLVGMSYLPTRYVLDGGTRQTAAFLQALVGVTMGLLRPVHGLVGDRVSRWRIWIFFVYEGLSGGALVLSALFDHFAWIATCAALFASFAAGYVVLTLPTITDLWGRDSVPHIGAHLYVDNAIAGLVLNPISGLMMDITGEATAPFLLFGTLQVVGVVLGFFLVYNVKRTKTEIMTTKVETT